MHQHATRSEQDCYTWTQTTAALIRVSEWQDLKAPRGRAWTVPVTVISTLACLLFVVSGMTGCALAALAALPIDLPSGPSGAGPPSVLTSTEVQLTQRNYRVVQTNLRGASRGFALLGILVLKPPDATEAFAKLLAGVENLEGHAVAVINVMQDSNAPFFLLFSLPTITFRADVVEFVAP